MNPTKTTPKKRTINQQAGTAKAALKRRGVQFLLDHRDNEVPIDYVPSIDLLKHFKTLEIIEQAKALQQQLREFKYKVQETGDELHEQLMEENEIRSTSRGGFTLATFDKTARILYKIDLVKEKNEEELAIAEGHFVKFMEEEFPGEDPKEHFLYAMFNDLIRNSKNEIDLRMVSKFNRYGSKIRNKHYQKFLLHLNQSYDTRHSKRFEIFEEKNDQNAYDSIVMTYAYLNPVAPEALEK